jgi:hypothetical protein
MNCLRGGVLGLWEMLQKLLEVQLQVQKTQNIKAVSIWAMAFCSSIGGK